MRVQLLQLASCVVVTCMIATAVAQTQPTPSPQSSAMSKPGASDSMQKALQGTAKDAPTYIESQTLVLLSEKRIFEYGGGVTVKHGDITLTAQRMQGEYLENNQIKVITAIGDVKMVKESGIKASGGRAVYDAQKEIIVLTENPTIEQNESALNADKIIIYVKEDRSEATGQVRVKFVKTTPTPSPTPAVVVEISPSPTPLSATQKNK